MPVGTPILYTDFFDFNGAWTPTWNSLTAGTGAVNEGWYQRFGEWVFWGFRLQFGTSPSFASTIFVNLPVNAYTGGGTALQACLGSWVFRDSSAGTHYAGSIGIWSSAGTSASFAGAWGGSVPNSRVGTSGTAPVSVAVDDVLSGSGVYRAA